MICTDDDGTFYLKTKRKLTLEIVLRKIHTKLPYKVWECVPFSYTRNSCLVVIWIIKPLACLRAHLISMECHLWLKQLCNVQLVPRVNVCLREISILSVYFFKCSHFFILIKCHQNVTFLHCCLF